MPFQVDRKLGVDIATQVTDGIRAAILTGFYKPGDILPKVLEFTRGLHVSLRAPLAAYRALKREGLISPRRGLGTVVVGPKADVFHGRVVIVRPYDNPYYYNAAVEAGLLRRLTAAGIRTGRDVLVITSANKGTTPLHPDPVDFVLRDPSRNADIISDALLAYVGTGAVPGKIALENAFVAGEG